jgi:hypothetical protein
LFPHLTYYHHRLITPPPPPLPNSTPNPGSLSNFFLTPPLTSEHPSINHQSLIRLIASLVFPFIYSFIHSSSSSSSVSLVSDSLATDGTRFCSHFLRAASHLPIIRQTVHNTKSLWTCDLARNQNIKTLPITKHPRTSSSPLAPTPQLVY